MEYSAAPTILFYLGRWLLRLFFGFDFWSVPTSKDKTDNKKYQCINLLSVAGRGWSSSGAVWFHSGSGVIGLV